MSAYDKYLYSNGTHYISNSGSDENRNLHGGKAGDQSRKEWQLRSWYKRPWSYVLRYTVQMVALKIAEMAIDAALNDKVGYDQYQRYTYWDALKAAGYDPSAITKACEADCTAGVNADVKSVGALYHIPALEALPKAVNSRNMRKLYTSAGFVALSGSKYTNSPDYLLPGDILLYENHHAATNVTCGKAARNEWNPERIPQHIPQLGDRILCKGCKGPDVKELQEDLMYLGYPLPRYGADGDFGSETEQAVEEFQRDYGCVVDGEFGPESLAAMNKALGQGEDETPSEGQYYPVHGVIPDVSANQGSIDMDEFCTGCDFAIFRARVSGKNDTKFSKWAQEMNDRGFPFAVYDFVKLTSEDDAIEQANAMFKACNPYHPRIYYLDTEKRADGVTYGMERKYLRAYVARLRELGVQCVGQYTGDYRWRTQYYKIEDLFDTLWIANWGKNDGRQGGTIKSQSDKIDLQQYTSNGFTKGPGAPGIEHRIDMNKLTGRKPLSWFTGREYEGGE